ncbi:MAG: hypothetical protein ABI919_04310 [Ramlibacter sp.]
MPPLNVIKPIAVARTKAEKAHTEMQEAEADLHAAMPDGAVL